MDIATWGRNGRLEAIIPEGSSPRESPERTSVPAPDEGQIPGLRTWAGHAEGRMVRARVSGLRAVAALDEVWRLVDTPQTAGYY